MTERRQAYEPAHIIGHIYVSISSIMTKLHVHKLWMMIQKIMETPEPHRMISRDSQNRDLNNSYPRQLVPKIIRTQDNSNTGQLVPKTTRTQDNS